MVKELIKERYDLQSEIIKIEVEMSKFFFENRGKVSPNIDDEWQPKRIKLKQLRNRIETINQKLSQHVS